MTRFLKGMFAIALVGMIAAQAQAGSFTLTPVVSASYDLAFTQDAATRSTTDKAGGPGIWQVDIFMTVDSLEAGEAGFANTGFNAVFNGVSDGFDAGWTANSATVDSNGALPGGIVPLFATNVDAGTPGDELGILVSIAGGVTGANDPRRKVGQVGGVPGFLGSLFVQWDAVATGKLSIQDILFQSNSTTGQFGNTVSGISSEVIFGVPEPSTIAMAGLSLLGLAFRRRAA